MPQRTVMVSSAAENTAVEKQAEKDTRSYLANDPTFQKMIRGINHPKEQ